MELSNSKTLTNLMRAFAGESMARNRYTFAAATAKKEGSPVLELLFKYTAGQEKEHAEIFYEYLQGCGCANVEISAAYPVDLKTDTLALLQGAVHNEDEEYSVIYPNFAKVAEEEGFKEIAGKFGLIANIEDGHSKRFKMFADYMAKNQLYVSETETQWICLNCGFTTHGTVAPKECPVCGHPQGWFCRMELAPYSK